MVNADSWWDGLSRDRFAAVLELVLDAIAEDYVTVEIIGKNINEWDGERDPASWAAQECGAGVAAGNYPCPSRIDS